MSLSSSTHNIAPLHAVMVATIDDEDDGDGDGGMILYEVAVVVGVAGVLMLCPIFFEFSGSAVRMA